MSDGRKTARQLMEAGLPRRYGRERRFRVLGMLAVSVGLTFLVLFFASIVASGYKAFAQSQVALDVYLDPALISPTGATNPEALALGDYSGLVRESLYDLFPEVSGRRDRRALAQLVSVGASYQLQNLVAAEPDAIGETRRVWVPASADVDMVVKGSIDRTLPEESRPVKDRELVWIDRLTETGRLQLKFNTALFTNGDSRDPELAGIRGALMGSFYMLLVTVALAFPIGVAAAVYLEEFAPRNRWTDLIEVNINNLAAVPSIVFGLLGLAVFINWASLPRSSPLVGGLVLSLMTLPVIIIAARASIKAVPPSIKEAALGLGASKMQMVFQHVLPLALPGILTGTIIGMARALGETAPLLMIGMVAFIVDIPQGPLDPSAALPVQVYLWADSPERAFVERTSAAIIVLLGFLLVMNLTAVLLRRRFERSF
ncbi:phosphate ABC transporter permease PstA [Lentisalinibacter orientalis]|uniref:phosphate ABC transporter permease PstA n=1 Tax=Lentisalinibacter orientalis TaxID=2992241 RepID=UPI0038632390